MYICTQADVEHLHMQSEYYQFVVDDHVCECVVVVVVGGGGGGWQNPFSTFIKALVTETVHVARLGT